MYVARLGQGNLIVQVVDRKGMINKYVAAVVKKNVDLQQGHLLGCLQQVLSSL